MQVFKAFFRIIKSNIIEISIYIVVFLAFTIIFSTTGDNKPIDSFTETKLNMAFINEDTDTPLVNKLEEYLSEKANFIDIEDDEKALQDALFYRDVEYILRVPSGFSKSLSEGSDIRLEKTVVPDSTTGIYIDSLINKFLNTARVYYNNLDDISDQKIAENVVSDLENETEVQINSFNSKVSKDNYAIFFNYMAYCLFAILILGVCSVMLVFNNINLKRRNYCSPIRIRNINIQLIYGNLIFAFITWFIMSLTCVIIYKSQLFSLNGLFLLINSLIFTFAALSISFLIANIVKNRESASAAANVIALGSSFISGVFVPQNLISEKVLSIASFTPTYWYVKGNNYIQTIVDFNTENIKPILNNMLIVVAFALAFLAISLVMVKHKRTES